MSRKEISDANPLSIVCCFSLEDSADWVRKRKSGGHVGITCANALWSSDDPVSDHTQLLGIHIRLLTTLHDYR